MTKILVVDDDPHIREVITFALEKAGFSVMEAVNGQQAFHLFTTSDEQPALLVLDINMPEMDGLECCREIRKTSDVPILFLSSRDDEIDRILGLEIGGDDYVTKPFSPRELVARIKVILKRTAKPVQLVSTELSYGHLSLNTNHYTTHWKTKTVALTPTEFAIVEHLLKQPKRVFNRDHLMTHAYPNNSHVSDRTIDSHIRHIRQKFMQIGASSIIETQHGLGYKLGSCQ